MDLPVGLARLAVERIDIAGLAADDHVAADHDRRGLAAPRQRIAPQQLAVLRAQRQRFALVDAGGALQGDRVDDPVRVGRRRRPEGADLLLPLDLARVGAQRVKERVLVLEVEGAVGDDRRELEQLAGLEAPFGGVERRLDPLGRQIPAALLVVAVDRPVDSLHLLGVRGRLLVVLERARRRAALVGIPLQRQVRSGSAAHRDQADQRDDRDVNGVAPGDGDLREVRHPQGPSW